MFTVTFEKTAFLGFGKKPEPKKYTITKEHEKELLPSFRAHDKDRKAMLKKPESEWHASDNDMHFMDAVTSLEAKTGIPNEHLYEHMYKHHGFDRKKK